LYDIEEKVMDKVVQIITSVLLIAVSCVLYIVTDKAKSLQAELVSHEQLIVECEKNIPRNRTCKLVAVEER